MKNIQKLVNNIFGKLFKTDNKSSIYFVIVNVFVAFLGFVRSFAFIKFLDFKELGILTLVQTGAMLIGFLQIGLINGGYRIVALQKKELSKDTNNVLFSFFSSVVLFLLFVYIILIAFNLIPDKRLIVLLIIIFGVSLLITNWLKNVLIAEKKYPLLNKADLIAAVVSLACLLLTVKWGIYGGAVALLVQPLLFFVIVLSVEKSKRPNQFTISLDKIRNILKYGFIPFLSGLFFLLYIQVERWSISYYLGAESLGHLYLLFLLVSLWVLVPTSVINLFFPRAVWQFENKNIEAFTKIINYHFAFVLAYCGIAGITLFFCFEYLVSVFFPNHLPYVIYVLWAVIGLTFRSLSDPISVYLNAVVNLRPIFWSELTSLIFYCLLIIYMVTTDKLSISGAVFALNLRYIFKFIYFGIVYLLDRRKIKKYYPVN